VTSRRCAVSIDLDAIACYYRIHALGAAPPELAHVVYERAVPRAARLFAAHGVHVTWFVVGRDAAHPPSAARLRERLAAGDELGNHSHTHPYDLARRSAGDVDREIGDCDRVLRELGATPRGFRAPGYDVSPAMLDALARRGYRYDSSVFPAPGYYAAKAAVMTALAARGRPSGAIMTDPRLQLAPADPYRPAMTAPWRRGQAPLVELPIAVTPRLRVPAIGTTLLLAPEAVRRRLLVAMTGRAVWNLELHGIDFCDAERDGIPGELVARQPDLRLPIADKLDRFDRLLTAIARDFAFATLAEIAVDIQREL
jgi:peptidoglycan-N-acetylglucosamine deacetylase